MRGRLLAPTPDFFDDALTTRAVPGDGRLAVRGRACGAGPLRSARPHRVAFVAEAEPAQQAAAVLHALGSLRHGPWWPGLDEVMETARRFYPDSLAEGNAALAGGPAAAPLSAAAAR